jgi:hypothetical protein
VAAGEEILGQFLGDASFPITWDAAAEQDFFWVYDDLHIPHPVSPMFFDIGGWWLGCDHMFRRFGTPFAVDWLAKNVNGYVYTTAIPADPDLRIDATEYSARYGARVPRDASFASTTVEGLATGGRLHPLQQAFLDHGAAQCGFCIPGQLIAGVALLAATPHPTRTEVEAGLAGNLCRCAGYEQIIEAVLAAAEGDGR